MSRGPSGRIVIEVEPDLKRRLYSALARDGRTLKDWFVGQANEYIDGSNQLRLFAAEPKAPHYQSGGRE
jgi:hypothetical protein